MRNKPYFTKSNDYTPPPPDVPLPVYQNPPRSVYNQPEAKKFRASQPPKPKDSKTKDTNPIFSDNFIEFLGLIAKKVGQMGVIVVITGLVFVLLLVDIFMGGVALSLAFEYDVPFRDGYISSSFFAGAISLGTSGIQTFLMVIWPLSKAKMKDWEKYLLIGIILIDTVIDMSGIAYFLNPTQIHTFRGLSAIDWLILILVTGFCMVSENIIVLLAGMNTSGRSLKDILKVRKK